MPDGFRVIDDFLPEPEWSELWTHFQFAELHPVSRTVGAWKLDDGVPLGGVEVVTGSRGAELADPSHTPIDHVLRGLLADPELHEGLVEPGWDRISARAYVYPRETGLSWHVDDHELYAGAFIYYAHPVWNAHWGGELLLAQLPPADADDPDPDSEDEDELPIMGYRFETEAYSERLLEVGGGSFLMPKPNRLVLLAGAPHMIARVSPAAGHNVRASVTGFFLRPRG
jgi:hypothetical protein